MHKNVVKRKVTIPEYAAECGIGQSKIREFIRSGELRAIDFSLSRGGRPRYLIDRADIESFEARRAVGPAPARATKRPRAAAGVIQFV